MDSGVSRPFAMIVVVAAADDTVAADGSAGAVAAGGGSTLAASGVDGVAIAVVDQEETVAAVVTVRDKARQRDGDAI